MHILSVVCVKENVLMYRFSQNSRYFWCDIVIRQPVTQKGDNLECCISFSIVQELAAKSDFHVWFYAVLSYKTIHFSETSETKIGRSSSDRSEKRINRTISLPQSVLLVWRTVVLTAYYDMCHYFSIELYIMYLIVFLIVYRRMTIPLS